MRPERPADVAAVRQVHEEAFGRAAEAALVDRIRVRGLATVALVAARGPAIVGHVLFSPVTIDARGRAIPALGLGPMAVRPAEQGAGIGARLVRAGLAACRAGGHGIVVVLGHPGYYTRFGFAPASRFGIAWEHPAPDEAFMALALRPGALDGAGGVARYLPEFEEV